MLKAYIRRLGHRCVDTLGNAVAVHMPSRRWLEAAFRDFVPTKGSREGMLAGFAANARRIDEVFEVWLQGGTTGSELTRTILESCVHLGSRDIWHSGLGLRSYVDVSVEVKVLRVFIDHLSEISQDTMPLQPLELTEVMLETSPNSRAVLLVHAELLLENGRAEEAVNAIQRALRIQAVCTTAQAMLYRAWELMRAQGSTAPEIEALDYDLSDKFCHLPFTHLSTGYQGNTFACSCPAWVPFSIGNVLEAKSADAVWNSDVAVEIRRSILDGDFSYCSRTQCSFITARKLPRKSEITKPKLRAYIDGHVTRIAELPEMVELNHDPTCNLACPSCRTEIIAARAEEIDQYAGATERVILPLLKRVTGYTYITGGGEAFASRHFRSILRALNRNDFPGLNVYLITNGQLLTPYRWSEFPDLPEMIGVLSISVDAARPDTYEKLRTPGKWSVLMRNLQFAAGLRREGRIRALGINFVVQQDNFREMLEFVALGDSIGADQIWFQRAVNYGAYDQAAFARVNVSDPSHPDHSELLEILRNPVLKRSSINMQMLLSLLPEEVASGSRLEFLY